MGEDSVEGSVVADADDDFEGEAESDGIADSEGDALPEGDALSGTGTASTGESAASDVVVLSQAPSVACLASQL